MSSDEVSDSGAQELVERFQAILTGNWKTSILSVAAELRIADLLAPGPRTSAELASTIGAHPPSVHRLLRALGTIGICAERKDGSFELTPLGSLLREESQYSQRAWTIWWGHHLWPIWGNLLYSVRTGQSARKLLQATEGFAHLKDDPEAAAIFNRASVELLGLTARDIVRAYDFAGLHRIIDIGGAHGALLLAILKSQPSAAGVLFDLPHAIDGAWSYFEEAGLSDRCELIRGDFFQSVPAQGDAYILKSVIHDWDDDRSLRILRNCRQAMSPAARLLVIEPIVPERLGPSAAHQALARSDLTMLVAHGAQERTESEFRALLSASGFEISRNLQVNAEFSLIEAFPVR